LALLYLLLWQPCYYSIIHEASLPSSGQMRDCCPDLTERLRQRGKKCQERKKPSIADSSNLWPSDLLCLKSTMVSAHQHISQSAHQAISPSANQPISQSVHQPISPSLYTALNIPLAGSYSCRASHYASHYPNGTLISYIVHYF
jgi:hypothetical protein